MTIHLLSQSGSGVFVGLLGVAYYAEIHHIAYFIVVQIFVGVFEVSSKLLLHIQNLKCVCYCMNSWFVCCQSTGWPGVVAVMGNWFGRKNRGLFLGVWNAHTSLGNILGTAIPSIWAQPGRAW